MVVHPRPATPSPVVPEVDEISAPFHAAAASGRLVVQRCDDCGRLRWTPRPMCPWCSSFATTWDPVQPTGRIWSYCVAHPPVVPAFADRVPFGVALVELDADPLVRMVGDLVDDIAEQRPATGDPVVAVFETVAADIGLVRWRLH